jgi:hypothetical protein
VRQDAVLRDPAGLCHELAGTAQIVPVAARAVAHRKPVAALEYVGRQVGAGFVKHRALARRGRMADELSSEPSK